MQRGKDTLNSYQNNLDMSTLIMVRVEFWDKQLYLASKSDFMYILGLLFLTWMIVKLHCKEKSYFLESWKLTPGEEYLQLMSQAKANFLKSACKTNTRDSVPQF